MAKQTEYLINKTGRAVTVLSVLVFCLGCIVYIMLFGTGENSLHVSTLSWSFTMVGFCIIALLGDAALAGYFQKKEETPTP